MTISTQLYANNAKTTLSAIISSTDTTITVVDGTRFPTPGAGQFFLATLEYSGVIEIIKVGSRSGNTFSNITRGQETTSPAGFPAGARIEGRTTRDTLTGFARKIDRVDEVSSVDLLSSPANSNSNSYICYSNDDGGNPVLALKNTSNIWRFGSHINAIVTGAIATVNTTGLTSTAIGSNLPSVTSGKYIVQFVSGVNTGIVRAITASSTNAISWGTSLAVIPSAGDQIEIYKSNISTLKELIVLSGSPVADSTKADKNNGTLTGTVVIQNLIKITGSTDTKVSLTANTSTTTLDLSTGSVFKVTIAANTTFAFINPPTGTDVFSFTIITLNDATPGRAVVFPASCKTSGGIMPPRTTAAAAVDVWTLYTEDAGTTYGLSLAINDER